MKEVQLQKAIVEALNYSGHYCWRANAGLIPIGSGEGSRMIRIGHAGTADIIGLIGKGKNRGLFLAVEVKLPKRKKMVTELQQQFLDYIEEKGGRAGVATSVEEALKICKMRGGED